MKKALSVLLAAALFAATPGAAKAAEETKFWTFASPLSTASMYAYCVAVAKTISTNYPEFNLTVSETQGTSAITDRIRNGEAMLGNSVSTSDYESYHGLGDFAGKPEPTGRMLWYYDYSKYAFFASREANIKSWSDLNGKKVNLGGTGTSMSTMTRNILELLGIKPEIFEANKSDAGEALTSRQIVGMCSSGNPDPFLMQICASIPVDIVSFSDAEMAKITAKYPYLVPITIPGGTYNGIDSDAKSFQFLGGIQASTRVTQEEGYKMFKAVYENPDMWKVTWPNYADMLETALISPIPLHAGTVQYLAEKGITVPAELIPPEYTPVS